LPEFLVQQLGIRLHGQPRLRHHLFLRGKDLPQPFNFRIHAVQQLFHSVDAQFAFFVAVQREADGHVFRQFEQHRLVWLGIWRLRRESRAGCGPSATAYPAATTAACSAAGTPTAAGTCTTAGACTTSGTCTTAGTCSSSGTCTTDAPGNSAAPHGSRVPQAETARLS